MGATLYAAVEGRSPFDADSMAAVLVAVLTSDPLPTRVGPFAPLIAGLLVKPPGWRTKSGPALGPHAIGR